MTENNKLNWNCVVSFLNQDNIFHHEILDAIGDCFAAVILPLQGFVDEVEVLSWMVTNERDSQ